MKVEYEDKISFKPMVITIETEDEADILWAVLNMDAEESATLFKNLKIN